MPNYTDDSDLTPLVNAMPRSTPHGIESQLQVTLGDGEVMMFRTYGRSGVRETPASFPIKAGERLACRTDAEGGVTGVMTLPPNTPMPELDDPRWVPVHGSSSGAAA